MKKYTNEQLTEMAKTAIDDRDNGVGVLYLQLVVTVGAIAGLPVAEVQRRIDMMADGNFSFQ